MDYEQFVTEDNIAPVKRAYRVTMTYCLLTEADTKKEAVRAALRGMLAYCEFPYKNNRVVDGFNDTNVSLMEISDSTVERIGVKIE